MPARVSRRQIPVAEEVIGCDCVLRDMACRKGCKKHDGLTNPCRLSGIHDAASWTPSKLWLPEVYTNVQDACKPPVYLGWPKRPPCMVTACLLDTGCRLPCWICLACKRMLEPCMQAEVASRCAGLWHPCLASCTMTVWTPAVLNRGPHCVLSSYQMLVNGCVRCATNGHVTGLTQIGVQVAAPC